MMLYNLTDGGDGVSEWVPNDETKAKQSERARERWSDPVYRAKQSEVRSGPDYRARMREVHSDPIYRAKQSERTRERWSDPIYRAKRMRPVRSFNPKTGETKDYRSATDAGADGFHPSNIATCCRGKLKTHGGLQWSYVGEGATEFIPGAGVGRSRPVRSFNPASGETKDYRSATAAMADGFLVAGVNNCCRGRAKTHGGLQWSYVETQGVVA